MEFLLSHVRFHTSRGRSCVFAHRICRKAHVAVLLCLWLAPAASWALGPSDKPLPPDSAAVLVEARAAEKKSDWFRAAELYGQLARQNPQLGAFRSWQLQSLQKGRFARRMHDHGYLRLLQQVSRSEALSILTDVLVKVQQTYVDVRAVPLERLFRSGIQELELELHDPSFVARFLTSKTDPRSIQEFADTLHGRLDHPPRKPAEFLATVQEIAGQAYDSLGMRPEVLLLEIAAGACNGLDEYTTFLTPEAETAAKPDEAAEASVSEPRFLETGTRVGYLRLQRFDARTVPLLDAGIGRLNAAGMRALILDLRGNPGGLLSAAVEVADRFVDRGVLVTTHGQIREYNRIYKARGNATISVPLIILIDGETASSAELVAAALHDLQRGTLLGQRTFGKGTIQETTRFRGGVGVTLTVARFASPRGQALDGNGVEPDVTVAEAASGVDMSLDAQLQAALDLARTMGAMGP
jgi:hypothetical protein